MTKPPNMKEAKERSDPAPKIKSHCCQVCNYMRPITRSCPKQSCDETDDSWFTFLQNPSSTKPSGMEHEKFISGSPVVRKTTISYKMCTLVNETCGWCIILAPSAQQSYVLMRTLIGKVKKILTSNIPLPLNSKTIVPCQCYLPILFVWTKIRGANGSRVLLNCYIFRAK